LFSKAVVPCQNKIILKKFSVYFNNTESPLAQNKIILATKIILLFPRENKTLKQPKML